MASRIADFRAGESVEAKYDGIVARHYLRKHHFNAVGAGQVITIPPEEIAPYRPSYAILAWNLARSGDTLDNDDCPEDVADFYAGIWAWLDGQ